MRGYDKTMVVSLAKITKFLFVDIIVRTYCPPLGTGWLLGYHSLKITNTAPPIMLNPRR